MISGRSVGSGSDLYPDFGTFVAIFKKASVPPDFEADRELRLSTAAMARPTSISWPTVSGPPCKRSARSVSPARRPNSGTLLPARPTCIDIPQQGAAQRCPWSWHRAARCLWSSEGSRREARPTAPNSTAISTQATLAGPWTVQFDPRSGGPASPVEFAKLSDWTKRPEAGIKYYSGTALYAKTFQAAATPVGPNGRPVR